MSVRKNQVRTSFWRFQDTAPDMEPRSKWGGGGGGGEEIPSTLTARGAERRKDVTQLCEAHHAIGPL